MKNGCSGATRRGRFAAVAAAAAAAGDTATRGVEAIDELASRVHWPLAGFASRTARAGRREGLRRLSTLSALLATGRSSVAVTSATNEVAASAAARVALTRKERRAPKKGASCGASAITSPRPPTPTSTSQPPLPSASELPPEPHAPRGVGDGKGAPAGKDGARRQRSTTSPVGRAASRRFAKRAAWRSCEADGVNTTPGMR